jgi:lipopolysaccharide transport system permease protein
MNEWNPVQSITKLWVQRDIIYQFTRRYVQIGFRGSLLGFLWIILGPLLMLSLYSFVFGIIFKASFSVHLKSGEIIEAKGLEYALGIFLGLSILNLFSGVLGTCSSLIVNNPNFVKKVVFPLEILPVAQFGQLTFNLFINLALSLLGIALLGPGIQQEWLWLPVILVPLLLLGIGLAWFISAIGVFVRDFGQLSPFLGSVLLYSSAVFYSVSIFHNDPQYAPYWSILKWNPLLHGVDQLRQVLMWGQSPNLYSILYLWGAGLVFFQLGNWTFHRLREDFADLL